MNKKHVVLTFSKYHGTGNDFILIDNRNLFFPAEDQQLVAFLCHRQFGIGADGLILLQNHTGFDFEMRYFNADGKEATMCGNGGRCAVHYARKLGIITVNTSFLANDGVHIAYIEKEIISLKMKSVDQVKIINESYLLDTGSPHLVIFSENIDQLNVIKEGREIRYDRNISEKGVNVNFAQITSRNNILLRTYERGVEMETYSCGTGSVATAIATCLKNEEPSGDYVYLIRVTGGSLQVSFTKKPGNLFDDIILTGSATFVYAGEIPLEM